MRHWGPTVTCAMLVLAVGLGARWVAGSAWESVVRYRSEYRFHARLLAGPRLAQRVILVTIDGLRLDTSRQLNFLNQLRARGVDGIALTGQPSLSNPGRAVMATGAGAHVHGITSNFATQPVTVDSVFSLARAAGLRAAVAGSPFWYRGFAPHIGDFLRASEEPHFPTPDELRHWQERDCAEKLEFARGAKFDFLALDWNAGDDASHDFGALSPTAGEIYRMIDDCLRELVASQNLSQTVLVVTSDHGHLDRGGHGGSEPEVVTVPLVLVGGPVRPGAKIQARQTDVAPTVCALLGLPLPSTSEGRVLVEALRLDPDTRGRLLALQQRQQRQFTAFRRVLMAGTLERAVERARHDRTAIAATGGLAVFLLLAWLFAGVLRSSAEWRRSLGALAVFYLVYFSLFRLGGLGYSLSAVNRDEYLKSFLQADMLAAATALLATTFVIGLVAGQASVRLSVAITLLVNLSLVVQVLWVYWSQGLEMNQWAPNLNLLFKAYLDLLALLAFCFALWATPLAMWAGVALRRRLLHLSRAARR